jgi:hypothetical protein
MKYLTVVLVILLLISANFLYNEYSTVDRWQKKAVRIAQENEIKPRTYAFMDKAQEMEERITPVSAPNPPEWVHQSPVVIALGLWIELAKNLVTLLLSFITALFMWWTYKREGKTVEVEVIND